MADGETTVIAQESTYTDQKVLIMDFPEQAIPFGKTFTGWNTSPDGTGTSYMPGQQVFFSRSTRLYAQWSDRRVTVTFNPNGGQCSEQTRTIGYGETISDFPEPTYQDMTFGTALFGGWFTLPIGGRPVNIQYVFTQDTIIYASWELNLLYRRKGEGIDIDENGTASGFSETSHLESMNELDFSQTYEVVICATTGSDIQSDQEVFSSAAAGSNLEFGIKRGFFAWEFVDREYWDVGNHAVIPQPNTMYYFKYAHEADGYMRCYISTDGVEWTKDYELLTQSPSAYTTTFYLGAEPEASAQYWRGTINPDRSYINIYGKRYRLVEDSRCVVNFDSRGGSSVPPVTVTQKQQIGTLPEPEWPQNSSTPKIFAGWWTTASGDGQLVTEETIVPAGLYSTILYARWENKNITVTFHENFN